MDRLHILHVDHVQVSRVPFFFFGHRKHRRCSLRPIPKSWLSPGSEACPHALVSCMVQASGYRVEDGSSASVL